MIAKSKEDKRFLKNLQEADESRAQKILQEIRQQGSVALLPELIDLMANTHYKSVQENIQKILNDVKRTDAVPILMQAIHNPKYQRIRKSLLTACWQNGLNYSNYIGDFVDISIEEPFEIAFEAFTVAENQEAKYEPELVEREVDKLKSAIVEANSQKRILLKYMIDYLEGKRL